MTNHEASSQLKALASSEYDATGNPYGEKSGSTRENPTEETSSGVCGIASVCLGFSRRGCQLQFASVIGLPSRLLGGLGGGFSHCTGFVGAVLGLLEFSSRQALTSSDFLAGRGCDLSRSRKSRSRFSGRLPLMVSSRSLSYGAVCGCCSAGLSGPRLPVMEKREAPTLPSDGRSRCSVCEVIGPAHARGRQSWGSATRRRNTGWRSLSRAGAQARRGRVAGVAMRAPARRSKAAEH